jgi:hypothetical protein
VSDLRLSIEVEISASDQPGILAQVPNLLEEALEHVDSEPFSDAGQARKLGQRLVQRVTKVSAMG